MIEDFLPFVDLGGTLAFAGAVWWELRGMRSELSSMLTRLVERLSILEERTRTD
tara:strand:+ start:615 stop:776 length:162 start_codon:yes stop_codon:yes gene_type:complete